jgi:hypothetical protein
LQYHLDGEGDFECFFAAKPILAGDVVIVLCSPQMREWAHKYMHDRVMLMDSTFGTNKHGYSLFAIMAASDQGTGVPVCFMITKSESTESIATALEQFRNFLDDGRAEDKLIRPATTLTDDSDAEQGAIR